MLELYGKRRVHSRILNLELGICYGGLSLPNLAPQSHQMVQILAAIVVWF